MPVVWPAQAGEPTWMCSDLQLQLGSLWMVRSTYARTVSSGGPTANPTLANPTGTFTGIEIEDREVEGWRGVSQPCKGPLTPFFPITTPPG